MPIHPTAVVDCTAAVDSSAEIGPYAVIDGAVRIGPGVRIHPFARVTGWSRIEAGCVIHSQAVVGDVPQDRAYRGSKSYCVIGEGSVVREGATVHRGTGPGSATVVGRRCFLMANAHVGHNCTLGDDVVLANGALLAGYVSVGDGAFISGNAGVHQFVRIGELAMIGGLSKITRDVPPFFMADGQGTCVGINTVGLRRAGHSPQERREIKEAYRLIYREALPFRELIRILDQTLLTAAGRRLVEFLRLPSRRGLSAGVRRVREAESRDGLREGMRNGA